MRAVPSDDTVMPTHELGASLPVVQVEDTYTGSDAVQALLREGDFFALEGDWKRAQEKYEAAVKKDAGLIGLKKLAQAQLQRRDMDGLNRTLSRLKNSNAPAEDLLLLEVLIALRTGNIQEARTMLNTATDSPHKHYGLALLAIIEGNHTQAQEELVLVAAGFDPALRTYAKIFQAAYEEYERFPDSPEIHQITLLSRALAETQQCELALPLLTQVVSKQDDYRDAWTVLGYCELTTERFEAARDALERAYNLDPEKPEIQYFLARTHSALADHDNAVMFGQYALKNDFEPAAEIRRFLAREAETMGDTSLAFAQYEALIELPEADIHTFTRFVSVSIQTGKHDVALAAATTATEKWPDEGKPFELLGSSEEALGQVDQAILHYQKALQQDPQLQSAKQKLANLQ